MKKLKENNITMHRGSSWTRFSVTALGLAVMMPLAFGMGGGNSGYENEDDWVGTLPIVHAGPVDLDGISLDQGVAAFYIEGPVRQVLDAAIRSGAGYSDWEPLPSGDLRVNFHGDQCMAFDLEYFSQGGLRCGMKTESGSGVVGLEYQGSLLRRQSISAELRLPMSRLEESGCLDDGIVLHILDPIGGRSRVSMRAIAGRLYLFQVN